MADGPMEEIPEPGTEASYKYWAKKTVKEKWNATAGMSDAHYSKPGSYKEGAGMDKTVVHKWTTREEWLAAEEESSKAFRS